MYLVNSLVFFGGANSVTGVEKPTDSLGRPEVVGGLCLVREAGTNLAGFPSQLVQLSLDLRDG